MKIIRNQIYSWKRKGLGRQATNSKIRYKSSL
ncbi:hypothetical protein SAMN06265364_13520 [Prevotella jejuni]|uniref:Uncharacterized protein n=1 Tax=Prevotella jejuni TaxID=1177574 RepID=A0AA94LLM0_9BACT|nr:hypothetical protein SAMN06265364_13520 [Prevotella jejuni]